VDLAGGYEPEGSVMQRGGPSEFFDETLAAPREP
jgi:hypothetical protein